MKVQKGREDMAVLIKRKQLDLKTREINWLIGKHPPPLSL